MLLEVYNRERGRRSGSAPNVIIRVGDVGEEGYGKDAAFSLGTGAGDFF